MKALLTISLTLVLGSAFAQQCCAGGGCGKSDLKPFNAQDAKFLAEAQKMMASAEGMGGSCNKSEHEAKAMKSTHKLYVMGKGYEKFCCAGMASEAREKYLAKGVKVGKVQKIKK